MAQGTADEVGLQRLREALFRPSRAQLVVGVLLAALGFAAITQVRTNNTDNTYAGYREQDLVDVLSALAGTSQRAQNEINQLEVDRGASSSRTSRRRAPRSRRRRSRPRSSASWPARCR